MLQIKPDCNSFCRAGASAEEGEVEKLQPSIVVSKENESDRGVARGVAKQALKIQNNKLFTYLRIYQNYVYIV